MNKNNLKQHLLTVVKELKEKNISIKAHGNGTYRIIHDHAIRHELLEVENFVDGLKLFLREKSLNKSFAKKTIIMRYMGILHKLLESQNPGYEVNGLLLELEQEATEKKEYKSYVPIKGLILLDDIEFVINSNSQIIKANKELVDELRPNMKIEEHDIFIQHSIKSSDFLKATEIGVELSKIILHFLRFVDYQTWDEDLLRLRLPGHGALMEELRVITVPVEQDETNSYTWQIKEAQDEDLEIDDEFIEDANDFGLLRFGEILNKYLFDELNYMENQVLRSITWFGESRMEHDPAARFIKLTLVLECLLNSKNTEPIASSLGERIAFILEDTLEERLKISKKVKQLYDIRSEIIHTGLLEVQENDLNELEEIAAQLIDMFLTDPQFILLKSKGDLIARIDKVKFS